MNESEIKQMRGWAVIARELPAIRKELTRIADALERQTPVVEVKVPTKTAYGWWPQDVINAVPCPACLSPVGMACSPLRGEDEDVVQHGVHRRRRLDAERSGERPL